MSLLSVSHLTKSYQGHKVLDDVSLDVEKGDIFGILGLSGAGKSTLVRCINGLETFDAGEIYFDGKLLCSPTKKISRFDQQKIARIFQSFNLLQQKNVLQNVLVALEIAKTDKKKRKEIALSSLKDVGLRDKIDAYPSQLSGGQKQRVAIARALSLFPKVILSDEATSALDPETTKSILDLLRTLNKEKNLTILRISHQRNVIESICNKVAILDKAKIIEQGARSDVFLSPKAERTKSLVYANHVKTELDENRLIRILFDGNTDEPLISNIVQDCQVLVSIVYADTKVSQGKVYGQTIIKCPVKKEEEDKLLHYLRLKNVRFEEVRK